MLIEYSCSCRSTVFEAFVGLSSACGATLYNVTITSALCTKVELKGVVSCHAMSISVASTPSGVGLMSALPCTQHTCDTCFIRVAAARWKLLLVSFKCCCHCCFDYIFLNEFDMTLCTYMYPKKYYCLSLSFQVDFKCIPVVEHNEQHTAIRSILINVVLGKVFCQPHHSNPFCLPIYED